MKKGIVVSDIHAGSIYGMLPPSFITFEGVEKVQNKGQKYLWECWLHFCTWAKTQKPDFVIINGDVIDGPQRKNHGAELSLPAPQDQGDAAIQTLRVLREAVGPTKWFFTQGTPYHVGDFGGHEEAVAMALGGTPYPSLGTGKLCREILWLETEGAIIEASHHIACTSGFYRLTALDREGQWSAIAGKDASKGIPKADVLIRSHVHHFARGEHASKDMFSTPCWQLQTRFMRKNSNHRMHPDIGGILITLDGEAKDRGENPCHVTKKLYRLPAVMPTKL